MSNPQYRLNDGDHELPLDAPVHDASFDIERVPRVSTTLSAARLTMARAPQASRNDAAGGRSASKANRRIKWFGLPRRDMREVLTVKVSYRGGSGHWVEIHARGRSARYPGFVEIYEILKDLNSQR